MKSYLQGSSGAVHCQDTHIWGIDTGTEKWHHVFVIELANLKHFQDRALKETIVLVCFPDISTLCCAICMIKTISWTGLWETLRQKDHRNKFSCDDFAFVPFISTLFNSAKGNENEKSHYQISMLIYIHHTQTFNKWLDRTFMSELEEPLKMCKDFSNTGSKMKKR